MPPKKTLAPKGKTSTAAGTSKSKPPVKAKETTSVQKLEEVICPLKQLANVVLDDNNEKMMNAAKWPLLIDTTGQATTFLKYRSVNYHCTANTNEMTAESVRLALIGSIRHGKPYVVDLFDTDTLFVIEKVLNEIQPNLWEDLLSKKIMKDEKYMELMRDSDPKTEFHDFAHLESFRFIVASTKKEVPTEWLEKFYPIRIVM